MQAGASATARDKDGCTPLDVAMAHAACVSDEHAHTQARGVCALLAAVTPRHLADAKPAPCSSRACDEGTVAVAAKIVTAAPRHGALRNNGSTSKCGTPAGASLGIVCSGCHKPACVFVRRTPCCHTLVRGATSCDYVLVPQSGDGAGVFGVLRETRQRVHTGVCSETCGAVFVVPQLTGNCR